MTTIFSLGNKGAKEIAEALKVNTSLSTLVLRGNHIGFKGVMAIAEALKTNINVKVIF